MSNERFGTWRYGRASASELLVVDAVTALTTYPPFLPPFDWMQPFDRYEKIMTHRVSATAGGILENLIVFYLTGMRPVALNTT